MCNLQYKGYSNLTGEGEYLTFNILLVPLSSIHLHSWVYYLLRYIYEYQNSSEHPTVFVPIILWMRLKFSGIMDIVLLVNLWLILKLFRTPYSISVCDWWIRLKFFRTCDIKNEAEILRISRSICVNQFTNEGKLLLHISWYLCLWN
jgi:hypothetical protein